MKRILFFTIISIALLSCTHTTANEDPDRQLREEIYKAAVDPSANQRPLEYYYHETGFDRIIADKTVVHKIVSVPGKHGITAQLFLPKTVHRGTVFFTHGYLDHTGLWGDYIQTLLSRGFAVFAFDLPGHGLSAGMRADIAHFNDYGESVAEVLAFAKSSFSANLPHPWIGFGHSTGCSAWIIYGELITAAGTPSPIQRLVLLHPLVRPTHWGLINAAYKSSGKMIRFYRISRPHKSTFGILNTPLFEIKVLPVSWVERLMEWQDLLKLYIPISIPCVVVQGTRDSVVDYKHNIQVLTHLFPNMSITYIKGAQHVAYSGHKKNAAVKHAAFEALERLEPIQGLTIKTQ